MKSAFICWKHEWSGALNPGNTANVDENMDGKTRVADCRQAVILIIEVRLWVKNFVEWYNSGQKDIVEFNLLHRWRDT